MPVILGISVVVVVVVRWLNSKEPTIIGAYDANLREQGAKLSPEASWKIDEHPVASIQCSQQQPHTFQTQSNSLILKKYG